ncbi:MAG: phosphohydrolase [Pyrobaculum sp.]
MLIFGDVHIGSRHARIQELRACLKGLSDDEVVITGDLFDDQHRVVGRDEAAALIRSAMKLLQIKPKRLYIAFSSSSHDPLLAQPLIEKIEGVEVFAYNGELLVETEKIRIVVTHGDKAVKDGVAAYFLDLVKKGAVGRALRRRLKVSGDLWLAYGHSHVPFLSVEEKIMNPGAWKIYGFRRIRGTVYELPSAKPLC